MSKKSAEPTSEIKYLRKHLRQLISKYYLIAICCNCLKGNGRCIKDDPYIGLCSLNDTAELLELFFRDTEKLNEAEIIKQIDKILLEGKQKTR